MSRPMKEAIVNLVSTRFDGIDSAVVVNSSRLTVAETETFRRDLRKDGVNLLFLRNRLARIALKSAGMERLGSILQGPTAMAFGGEGAIAISKIIVEKGKKLKNLEIVGGYIDGEVVDKTGVEKLASMPGKKELQAMVLQSFFGPVSEFHASMGNLLTEMHGLIEALGKKQGA